MRPGDQHRPVHFFGYVEFHNLVGIYKSMPILVSLYFFPRNATTSLWLPHLAVRALRLLTRKMGPPALWLQQSLQLQVL